MCCVPPLLVDEEFPALVLDFDVYMNLAREEERGGATIMEHYCKSDVLALSDQFRSYSKRVACLDMHAR